MKKIIKIGFISSLVLVGVFVLGGNRAEAQTGIPTVTSFTSNWTQKSENTIFYKVDWKF